MIVPLFTEDRRIVERLARLRRSLRRRLLAFGVLAVLAAASGGLLGLIAIDRLALLPPFMRVALACTYVVGVIAAMWRWIAAPALTRISAAGLARQIEMHFGQLNDRLSSSVFFLERGSDRASAMERQVIARASSVIEDLPLDTMFSSRPLQRAAVLAAIGLGLLTGLVVITPQTARLGMARYAAPFSAPDWPRRVEILPLTGDVTVACGETAQVRLRITRGDSPRLRPVARFRDAGGHIASIAMRRTDGGYSCDIDHVTAAMDYWFEAGDDSTAARPGTISIVQRPAVLTVVGHLYPPAYAAGRPATEIDLTSGALDAITGSTLDLDVRIDRSVATAFAIVDGQDRLPLHADKAEPTTRHGSIVIDRDYVLDVRVADADGFTNAPGQFLRVKAVADEPPHVTVVEPRGTMEVTPEGLLHVKVRADDDLGVASVALLAQRAGDNQEQAVAIPIVPAGGPAGDSDAVATDYMWRIHELNVRPGDAVIYRARAMDACPSGPEGGQVSYSARLQLNVVSAESFERLQREQISGVDEGLRRLLIDQTSLCRQIESLAGKVPQQDLERSAGEPLVLSAAKQMRLAQRAQELGGRVSAVEQRLSDNAVANERTRANLRDAAGVLTDDVTDLMHQAAHVLDDAASPADTQSRIEAAGDFQHQASDHIKHLLAVLGQWGDFHDIINRARDLLDRQQAIRRSCDRRTSATLGEAVDRLSAEGATAVQQDAQAQTLLGDDMDRLLEDMGRLEESLESSEPATAAAIAEGRRAALAAQIPRSMRNAAEAIAANRLAAAKIGQRAAEAGLADVLNAFQQGEERRLQYLARRQEEARRAVAELLRTQDDLIAANQEASQQEAEADAWQPIGHLQFDLMQNTRRLALEWRERLDMIVVARALYGATSPMQSAAAALLDADGAGALDWQREARESLASALEDLEKMAEGTRRTVRRQHLSVLRTRLEDIRSRQSGINDGSRDLIEIAEAGIRLGRLETRKASALRRDQDGVREDATALRSEMDGAIVYGFVLDRALAGMGRSSESLAKRLIDRRLGTAQASIVSQLDVLIQSLTDLSRLALAEENARYGGGQGGSSKTRESGPPVPPLAELLVLRSMQKSLNERTAELAAGFDPDRADEATLAAVRDLASEQHEIRALAGRLMKGAQTNAD